MNHPFTARRPARQHPGSAAAGPMARTRRLAGQPALAALLLGALALTALIQTTGLANRVVAARRQIETMHRERAYLEAEIGILESEWNRVTARDVVVRRAAIELGLVAPEAPGSLVIVVNGADESAGAPAWARVLDTVGGGGAAVKTATAGEERRP